MFDYKNMGGVLDSCKDCRLERLPIRDGLKFRAFVQYLIIFSLGNCFILNILKSFRLAVIAWFLLVTFFSPIVLVVVGVRRSYLRLPTEGSDGEPLKALISYCIWKAARVQLH